jgi:hypothetical protein
MFWDILNELATVGQVPLPASGASVMPTVNQRKRSHSVYDDSEHDDIEVQLTPTHTMEASVAPVVADLEVPEAFAWVGALDALQLPMYGAELGRLQHYHSSGGGAGTGSGGALGLSAEDALSIIDNDAMTMWTGAPMSLGCVVDSFMIYASGLTWTSIFWADDWGTYFGLMNELNEEQPPP